jgi:hypothetical protein
VFSSQLLLLWQSSLHQHVVMVNQLVVVPPLFRTFLDDLLHHTCEWKSFLPMLGIELQIIQPLASHLTDCAILPLAVSVYLHMFWTSALDRGNGPSSCHLVYP